MCCPTEKSILEKEVRALKIQESAENYLEAILVLIILRQLARLNLNLDR